MEDIKKELEIKKIEEEIKKIQYQLEKEKKNDLKEEKKESSKWNKIWNQIKQSLPAVSTFILILTGMIALIRGVNQIRDENRNANDILVTKELISFAESIDTIKTDFDAKTYIQIIAYDLKILPFLIEKYILTDDEKKKSELIESIKLIQINKPGNREKVIDILFKRFKQYIEINKNEAIEVKIKLYYKLMEKLIPANEFENNKNCALKIINNNITDTTLINAFN